MTKPDDQTSTAPWSISETLRDRRILVTGTTGFLGKVYASMLLRFHPDIEQLYLMIRSRSDQTPEQRFESALVNSPVFDPLREVYGEAFGEFLDEKITILDGDITDDYLGLEADRAAELSEAVDSVVNCAGLTNFNPNLESALSINTLAQRNFLEFLRLADDPGSYLHVSTCFVAGNQSGRVPEVFPDETTYPRYEELGVELDHEREIEDCRALIDHAEQLADDQERQSRFAQKARQHLRENNLPTDDDELFDEAYERARNRWLYDRLSDEGLERAEHWGWPNIYTYTKSLGERILADCDDIDVSICRPAIIETSLEYPKRGWIQGVNTSGPLSYLMYKGHRMVPTHPELRIDMIPADFVSSAMIAMTAGLIDGRHHDVYQLGSGDRNPVHGERVIELTQLGARKLAENDDEASSLQKLIVRNADSIPVSPEKFQNLSAPRVRQATEGVKGLLDRVPTDMLGGFGEAVEAVKGAVDSAHKAALTTEKFFDIFLPFIAENRYIFEYQNHADLVADLSEAERQRYRPKIDDLDWRDYWINVHMPALRKYIFPQIDERLGRRDKEVYTYEDLQELFDSATDHFADRVAMQHHADGGVVERYTYEDLQVRAERAGHRLSAQGVGRDTPVLLASENRPQWGMAYFGILEADGIAVPVDPDSSVDELLNFVESARARVVLLSPEVADRVQPRLEERLRDAGLPATILSFDQLFRPALESAEEAEERAADVPADDPDWSPKEALVRTDDGGQRLASLIYTSGTTGQPKGVMLTHENFTSLLSNLKSVFDVDADDEFVSVLPLHHTFEFACGFLLPLSEGSTVTYLDELTGEELMAATTENRATALIGVPALWELLYRRIQDRLAETHPAVQWSFRQLERANSLLRDRFDINIGPLVFGAIHRAFGGRLEYLVSGGAALPSEILEGFYGLGFDMYEGYGLTEAAPVLTVNRPDGHIAPGTVGRALPDIDVDLVETDDDGVGEVVARGPNVMDGYLDRPEATDETLEDGWLKTGDLGEFDEHGNLRIVGRQKEVIVTAAGKNIYPDELESYYGGHEAIDELSVVGLPDDSGGERVACLVRPDIPEDATGREAAEIREEVREWFRLQGSRTANHKRIQVLRLWDEDFPRTATRKIKRNEVVELLERMIEAERQEALEQADEADGQWAWLDGILAGMADASAGEIHAGTQLVEELGFDSLMFVELASILENREVNLTTRQLQEVQTVADLRAIVEEGGSDGQTTALVETSSDQSVEEFHIPPSVADMGKSLLYRAQMAAYDKLYDVEVYGRAHIPHHNPNVLVAANHCSHLDMGLVKYALGDFGRGIRALAAADYFFRNPTRKTYFKNFTNLLPVERSGSLEEALGDANRAIERGETLLIFPEGTRSKDGKIHDFQSGLGYLVDRHDIDVLPMYIDGTYEALPKGQSLPSPTRRRLKVYIGDLLSADHLRRETTDLEGRERFSAISRTTQSVIESLRDRASGLDEGETLEPLMAELDENFRAENANGTNLSYYFTLGERDDLKWSVRVDEGSCRITRGKPDGGRADCVIKTSPAMFRKIVREGYVPSVDEFVSGDIKTNDPELLRDFQHFFGLS